MNRGDPVRPRERKHEFPASLQGTPCCMYGVHVASPMGCMSCPGWAKASGRADLGGKVSGPSGVHDKYKP